MLIYSNFPILSANITCSSLRKPQGSVFLLLKLLLPKNRKKKSFQAPYFELRSTEKIQTKICLKVENISFNLIYIVDETWNHLFF